MNYHRSKKNKKSRDLALNFGTEEGSRMVFDVNKWNDRRELECY